jgi:hypothetical protein
MERENVLHVRLDDVLDEKEAKSFWEEIEKIYKSEKDDLRTLAKTGRFRPSSRLPRGIHGRRGFDWRAVGGV